MTTTITPIYQPRHSWGEVRMSTTRAQLFARLTVVAQVGKTTPNYIGRHRTERAS